MLSFVVEKFDGVLDKIWSFRRERRELADSALRAISHALNETYLYYSRYDRMGPNRDIEEQLSRYWAAAAIPLRHIDPELAMICENKSEYWTNPEHFTDADIKKFGIGLGEVRRRYRTKLFPNRKLISGGESA